MGARSGGRLPHVDGFEIHEIIGRGGFSTVYRAVQPRLGRTVALKVLHPSATTDEASFNRFERECQAIGSLTGHRAVVTVFAVGETSDGDPFLALEYLPGGSVDARLRARGARPWQEVVVVGQSVAEALESAHGLGILHRDVKPANVLADAYGRFKLGDFGIAGLSSAGTTTTGHSAMTVAYAAPEVLLGRRATEASDLYGLGATLYALLTGAPAFSSATDESFVPMVLRVTNDPLDPLPAATAPDDLRTLVAELMAKEAADRPASAAVVRRRLDAIGAAPGPTAGSELAGQPESGRAPGIVSSMPSFDADTVAPARRDQASLLETQLPDAGDGRLDAPLDDSPTRQITPPPTPEPVAEPDAQPAAEPMSEPFPAPPAEPIAAPAALLAAETIAVPIAEPEADHVAETIAPAAEPPADQALAVEVGEAVPEPTADIMKAATVHMEAAASESSADPGDDGPTDPDDESEAAGGRRWVFPTVVAVAVLIAVMVGAVAFDLQRSGDGDKAASQAAAENLTRTTAVRATTTSARPTTTIPATTTTAVPVPTPQDIAKANPAGSYKGSSKVTGCSGWGKGSACSGFEGPLQYLSIECPQTGCVASVWGQDFPLTWDGAANVATLKGVDDGVTCNGGKSKLATDLELRLTTVGANWVEGGWLANALTGTLNQRSHGTCGVVAGQTVYSNNPTMKFEMLYGREGP